MPQIQMLDYLDNKVSQLFQHRYLPRVGQDLERAKSEPSGRDAEQCSCLFTTRTAIVVKVTDNCFITHCGNKY